VFASPLSARPGLRIEAVADGPAKAAGLQKGDVILSVDGVRVRTYEAIRAVLGRVAEGATVDIEVVTAATGAAARRAVAVRGGRIGVTVEEIPVPGP
jgi:S1-C subfamily serine protease